MRRWRFGPILLLALGACGPGDTTRRLHARVEDQQDLRALVSLLIFGDGLPMEDGVLDVYALVRKGDITTENYDVFRSARSGTGPTDAEIERYDYTNFPWERYRGRRTLGQSSRPFPLLWEKTPDADGKFLVGLSDGSVVLWDRATLERTISLTR